MLAGPAKAGEGESAWRDIESRIQYGYYTEDRAALGKLEELIGAGDAHDKLRGYYGGLLAWRRALLAAPGGAAAQGGSTSHDVVSATKLERRSWNPTSTPPFFTTWCTESRARLR